jgi:hypothetical protein
MSARVAAVEDDDDVTELAELRRAYRTQRELLEVLHGDGIAATRDTDRRPPFPWFVVVSFVVGVLLGVAGTLAALTGRLATVETKVEAQAQSIEQNRAATVAGFTELRTSIQELTRTLSTPPQQRTR